MLVPALVRPTSSAACQPSSHDQPSEKCVNARPVALTIPTTGRTHGIQTAFVPCPLPGRPNGMRPQHRMLRTEQLAVSAGRAALLATEARYCVEARHGYQSSPSLGLRWSLAVFWLLCCCVCVLHESYAWTPVDTETRGVVLMLDRHALERCPCEKYHQRGSSPAKL